jgi:DNA gyrase/topoisomerase IV subunit A
MTVGGVDPESERWAIRQRLNLLVAMVSALDRMEEINAVVRASADRPAAVRALGEAPFGFSEFQAHHVLDIQVARQTEAGRRALRIEIEQAQEQLAEGD